ncbi:hypothetical protein [uncultured Clostridium sp.]|nr:hypothetical protein [uncultured Clostridium sp.]
MEKVAKHNNQLNEPSKHTNIREELLQIYKKGGYKVIDEFYIKSMG